MKDNTSVMVIFPAETYNKINISEGVPRFKRAER